MNGLETPETPPKSCLRPFCASTLCVCVYVWVCMCVYLCHLCAASPCVPHQKHLDLDVLDFCALNSCVCASCVCICVCACVCVCISCVYVCVCAKRVCVHLLSFCNTRFHISLFIPNPSIAIFLIVLRVLSCVSRSVLCVCAPCVSSSVCIPIRIFTLCTYVNASVCECSTKGHDKDQHNMV